MNASGVLLIDKPVGLTSFDVIRQIRRIYKTKKVGHTGTLDPFASGLLVVLLGNYTKAASYLEAQDKIYLADVQLGAQTNTDDCTGEIIARSTSDPISLFRLEDALRSFVGTIQQKPPIFSAIWVNGVRAYKKARQGEDFELPSRPAQVHSIEIVDYEWPRLRLLIHCAKGTYIRSIARDLGLKLECYGFLQNLRRLKSGDYDVIESSKLENLNDAPATAQKQILSGISAFRNLPLLAITEEQAKNLRMGRSIQNLIIPAQVGIQRLGDSMDPRLRGNDKVDPELLQDDSVIYLAHLNEEPIAFVRREANTIYPIRCF